MECCMSHHRLDTFEMLLSICNFCRHSNLGTLKGKLRLVISHRVTHQSKTCRLRQVHALSPQPTLSLCGLFRIWTQKLYLAGLGRTPAGNRVFHRACPGYVGHMNHTTSEFAQLERLGNKPRELKNKPIQKNPGDTWHTKKQFFTIQVVPGRAGGGSFKRKKNYKAKKEFAYRMCARYVLIDMTWFKTYCCWLPKLESVKSLYACPLKENQKVA